MRVKLFGTGMMVEVVMLVVVTVALVNEVVDVTIVKVESVATIIGSCVRVMTAKKPYGPGFKTSD
jgi:hypothetical protein